MAFPLSSLFKPARSRLWGSSGCPIPPESSRWQATDRLPRDGGSRKMCVRPRLFAPDPKERKGKRAKSQRVREYWAPPPPPGTRRSCSGSRECCRRGTPTGSAPRSCPRTRHATPGGFQTRDPGGPSPRPTSIAVPVLTPLPDVPVHVVKPPGVRDLLAHWMCRIVGVAIPPTLPFRSASASPEENRVAVPARHAYSHSASVGSRTVRPVLVLNCWQKA